MNSSTEYYEAPKAYKKVVMNLPESNFKKEQITAMGILSAATFIHAMQDPTYFNSYLAVSAFALSAAACLDKKTTAHKITTDPQGTTILENLMKSDRSVRELEQKAIDAHYEVK